MRIDILSCVPELLESPLQHSIIKRAREKGLVDIQIHNIRDYTLNKHLKVDDEAYGYSAGMVMQIEPIDRLITHLKEQREYDEVIYTSPDGETFNQKIANELSLYNNIIILCGHYKGIDHRIREHLITREISVGDFVLTGGELASLIMTDAVVRLLPGAMSDLESALTDFFFYDMLSTDFYTRPAEYKGWKVPDILLSGNEKLIREWEYEQSLERTKKLRPDLLKE